MFWFGTNDIGQDLWARMWGGTRTSLLIGIVAALIEAVVGILAGLLWGYVRKLDFIFTEIYNIINSLAANGTAVIVVSSELLELLGICDRILVVNNGRISGEFDRENFSQDAIMQASFDMGGTEHERV